MDTELKEAMTHPSARFYSLDFLVKKLGCPENFITEHQELGSLVIPQAIAPDGCTTYYFLKTPENIEYVTKMGIPYK